MTYTELEKIVRAWCNVKEYATLLAQDYPFIDHLAPALEIESAGPDIIVRIDGKRLKPEHDVAYELINPIVDSAAYAIGEIIPVSLNEAIAIADFKLEGKANWRGPFADSIKRLADLLKTGENWKGAAA